MLAFIISLIYRGSCKKSLTGMRRHRWSLATAN